MNEQLYSLTNILNILFIIAATIGGYIALRSGKHRTSGEIQDQVIDALKAEVESLQRRFSVLEKENARLEQTMSLIKQALRRRGLTISIEGDLVTIDDSRGNSSQAGRIQETTPQPPRRASQPAPRSQWARKPWMDETTELPKTEE